MELAVDEYKQIFIEDTEEYVIALNENLFSLEKEKENKEIIDNIFRIVHSLKSSAAVMGYSELSHLSHKAEDVMSEVRNGEREVTTELIDVLFEVLDIVRLFIDNLMGHKDKTEIDIEHTIKKFDKILSKNSKKENTASIQSPIKSITKDFTVPNNFFKLSKKDIKEISISLKKGFIPYLITITFDKDEPIAYVRTELMESKISKFGRLIRKSHTKEDIKSAEFKGIIQLLILTDIDRQEILKNIDGGGISSIQIKRLKIKNKIVNKKIKTTGIKKSGTSNSANNQETTKTNKNKNDIQTSESHEQAHKKSVTETIRVSVNKLDTLMDMVGELSIITSGLTLLEKKILREYKNKHIYNELSPISDKLKFISSELQNSIMQTRMLPIGYLYTQIKRQVRQLSKELNKEVELVLKGEETELDKTVIDALSDPFKHLIRNSLDHGIEDADNRIKFGKSAKGKITITASQTGNHVVISIEDDGRGIDIENVRKKIIKKGMSNREIAETLHKDEILNFLFEPGFSTAEEVSEISGRGVGLDVVKNILNRLNGTIEIKTEQYWGTEFIFSLPLTLSIVSVIIVKSEDDLYAIPILDINETIRIKKNQVTEIDGKAIIDLRGETLPIFSLNNVFENKKFKFKDNINIPVIICSYMKKKIGLIVDKIIRSQEIVLKPLEKHYRSVDGLSGSAILGDGKIVHVIDVTGVVKILNERIDNK